MKWDMWGLIAQRIVKARVSLVMPLTKVKERVLLKKERVVRATMDDWYTAVYALPTVWPDVSMMGMNNMRKVVGYDFHYMRKKYRVPGMWGTV